MENDDRGSDVSTRLTYLLIGGGIGAIIALLFAPKPGSELRGDIADVTRKGIDKTREGARDNDGDVCRLDAARRTVVARAGAADVPRGSVLAEAAAAQMDHAAGPDARRRYPRSRVGAQSVAPDQTRACCYQRGKPPPTSVF